MLLFIGWKLIFPQTFHQVKDPKTGVKLAACKEGRKGARKMTNVNMKNIYQPLLRYDHLSAKKEHKQRTSKRDKKVGRFKQFMLSDSERRKMAGDDSDDDYSPELYDDFLKKSRKEI